MKIHSQINVIVTSFQRWSELGSDNDKESETSRLNDSEENNFASELKEDQFSVDNEDSKKNKSSEDSLGEDDDRNESLLFSSETCHKQNCRRNILLRQFPRWSW